MKCDQCQGDKVAVVETTKHEGSVYRWRYCRLCFHRFKTKEDLFTGSIPQVNRKYVSKRLVDAEEKEFQKGYKSKSLQDVWKV
jgi:transcriptional regulator NrdR family protein